MADLNELSRFEKDLKNLIESRNTFQPTYTTHSMKKRHPALTLMDVNEHGQPYKTPSVGDMTFMAAEEHGQPYKTPTMITRMAIREHGQQHMTFVAPDGQIFSMYMAVREHGQPFLATKPGQTKMQNDEHGKPFRLFDFGNF